MRPLRTCHLWIFDVRTYVRDEEQITGAAKAGYQPTPFPNCLSRIADEKTLHAVLVCREVRGWLERVYVWCCRIHVCDAVRVPHFPGAPVMHTYVST